MDPNALLRAIVTSPTVLGSYRAAHRLVDHLNSGGEAPEVSMADTFRLREIGMAVLAERLEAAQLARTEKTALEHLDALERLLQTDTGRARLRRIGAALGLTVPEIDRFASE